MVEMLVEKWDMREGKVTSVRCVIFAEKKAYIFPLQKPVSEAEMPEVRRCVEAVLRAKSVLVLDTGKGARVEAASDEALARLAAQYERVQQKPAPRQERVEERVVPKTQVVKGGAKSFPKAVWEAIPRSVRENSPGVWTQREVEKLLYSVKPEKEYTLNQVYQFVTVGSRNHTRALIQLLAWQKRATMRKVNERRTTVVFHKLPVDAPGPIEGPTIDKGALQVHADDRAALERSMQ